MTYRFKRKDPNKAYISNNLVLPKFGVNLAPVMNALTFIHGEEEIIDPETNQLVGTRPRELYLWDENRHHIIVPREFLAEQQYPEFPFEFVDHRPQSFPEVDIEDNITLRDGDQIEAFQALLENYSGTLNLACGKGKTVLALKLAATLRIPTLVVVNTTALLEQWKDEIEEHLGVNSVGVIQGETVDWKEHPITIAMVHTLSLHREEWPMDFRLWFGLVFYDEGHHMSAPVFVRSADLFFGKRYSLTATAKRIDGLEAIYQHHLGKVIHRNLEQELIPETVFHKLKWEFDNRNKPLIMDSSMEVSLPRVRTYLGGLDWRNRLIYQDIRLDLASGRNILVLSHSVDHVNRLAEIVRERPDANAGIITGATPQGDRMDILRDSNPVFGTFQLAREGLNKPSLDTLYVTTPFSSPNDLQQAWGRIQRQFINKMDPLVRVYEDRALDCCVKSCRNLKRHLRELGYPLRQINVEVEIDERL
jgi:superfamily II DNA or RNA helicase